MNKRTSSSSSSSSSKIPAWVRCELRRLEAMAAMGGSSAALEFERQAAALKAKYVWPRR